MKRIILILAFLIICTSAYATETITDLNTNSPVTLGNILTVSGTYSDTDSNSATYCKFLIKYNELVVERLSDEQTFTNGDFYAQRTINEPLYKRGNFYDVEVTCGQAQQDTNFTVSQRESIQHTAVEEFNYFFDRDNIDTFFIVGSLVLFLILTALIFIFIIKLARGF